MSRETWKATERAIAGRLGGQRVPVSGRAQGDAPDIGHPRLSLEVKHRESLPAWLREAMAEVAACASREQIPVAILCVLRLEDLAALLESGARGGT